MNFLSGLTIAALTLLLTLAGMTDAGAAPFSKPLGCGATEWSASPTAR